MDGSESTLADSSRKTSKAVVKIGRIIVYLIVTGVTLSVISSVFHHVTRRTDGYGSSDMNTALFVRSAISAYYTEYRSYPVRAEDTKDGDFLTDHTLMDVLLGSDKSEALNPRNIVFFAGRKSRPMSGDKHRRGISYDDYGGGELWDSWGNYYHVRIDLNRDNQVAEPNCGKSKVTVMIPLSVIVWSAGKDGIEGTSDDIKIW